MSIREMVEEYNELAAKVGEKQVKTFRDKETATRRLAELRKRSKVKDLPFRGVQHKIRPSSLRGHLFPLLERGATMDELVRAASKHRVGQGAQEGYVPVAVKATLRILHVYHGYGMRYKGDKIYVVTA